MSISAPRTKRRSGNRLYLAVAAWLVLVVAGALCTWYGWFGPGNERLSEEPRETPTVEAAALPAATVAPPSLQPSAAVIPGADEEFGYGIAIHGTGGGNVDYMAGQVQGLGLGWVKQQMRWSDLEMDPGVFKWDDYDWVADASAEKGLKLMFSVLDAPDWLREDYVDENPQVAPPEDLAAFADFLGTVVDRYKGRLHAIEVWNEQNLDREWDTAEGVSAERYVEMLRLAYQAIKSRDPSVIVISGALSPVGFTGTDENNPERVIIVDDLTYFDQLVAAGLLNYCDCVGAHHNGINVPPDVGWDEGYNDPDAQFRGPFDNPDHSWAFKSTLWGYHDRIAAAGGDKPLCVTEFGWATAEGFEGFPPGFEFALDNTLEEQAQWDVEAFQLMRQWGFVRLAFLWNLNFSQLGWGPEDPNAPYAITDFQGVARPAFNAIGAMEKP